MTEHLDLDALADLLAEADEGVSGQPSARGHLSACAGCADRLRELEAAQALVTASLASLAAPVLPPEVADRLAAALAAEPAVTPRAVPAAAGTGTGTTGTATVTPLAGRRRTPRAWLPAVAASVVLVGGGLLGYSLLAGPRGDEPNATAALDSSAERATGPVRSASGLDYADAAAVASALPGVLTGTVGEPDRRQAQAVAPGSTALPAGPLADSPATGPTPATPAPAPTDAGAARSAADPLDRLRDPAGLASCLVALLPPDKPDVRPLALDYARYEGAPALAVVLPDPDPTKVSIFVVGPDCSQADDDTLFFTRLDRL